MESPPLLKILWNLWIYELLPSKSFETFPSTLSSILSLWTHVRRSHLPSKFPTLSFTFPI